MFAILFFIFKVLIILEFIVFPCDLHDYQIALRDEEKLQVPFNSEGRSKCLV
jgi:hypothetical protein